MVWCWFSQHFFGQSRLFFLWGAIGDGARRTTVYMAPRSVTGLNPSMGTGGLWRGTQAMVGGLSCGGVCCPRS